VEVGAAKHEVGARPANLGTVEKQSDVPRFGVFSAFLEAVLSRA